MANYDIPLHMVTEGMFLFLGFDSLLDEAEATAHFCEPARVTAIRFDLPEGEPFPRRSPAAILSARDPSGSTRPCCVELETANDQIVVVHFADDRHMVAGVNLPNNYRLPLIVSNDDRENLWLTWLRSREV